ncbi:hypothetical protein QBC43DRAFT_373709 [Cladorrhinum sp. PSN259]|nr:hypothetical protein QBC43DRAFT_373709 [Cladorrhinum sp. PSN259]
MSSSAALTLWKNASDPQNGDMKGIKSAIPCPGKIFIMTDATCGYALALEDGELKFVELVKAENRIGACWLWRCVEESGWMCFRNAVSGTYLGVRQRVTAWDTVEWHLCAFETTDLADNRFCVRHSGNGQGYELWVFQEDKDALAKIGVVGHPSDGSLEIVEDREPMRWIFIEV